MAKNILPLVLQVRGNQAWKQWVVDQANRLQVPIPELIDQALREWAERRKVDPPPQRMD